MAVMHKKLWEPHGLWAYTACDKKVSPKHAKWRWADATCKNCRRLAPLAWRRKWGMAA